MSKPSPQRNYSVAVDFDGVIHSYTTPWQDSHIIPDPPVEGAIEWLKEISRKFQVIIFSTRAKSEAGREAVRAYLAERDFIPDDITAIKPPALVYIDDRAWRFEGTFPTAQEIHEARPWNKPERGGSANFQQLKRP